MEVMEPWKGILRIQKFRRMASYAGFYCFVSLISYAYTSNTTRAGMSRADQFYATYPAGIELLTDTAKLYKAALGNCFEEEEWGPIEFSIMAKHFERQGKPPYAYHAVLEHTAPLSDVNRWMNITSDIQPFTVLTISESLATFTSDILLELVNG